MCVCEIVKLSDIKPTKSKKIRKIKECYYKPEMIEDITILLKIDLLKNKISEEQYDEYVYHLDLQVDNKSYVYKCSKRVYNNRAVNNRKSKKLVF